MIEYRLIAEFNTNQLSNEVTQWLSEGWHLYGEPFVFGDRVCQAISRMKP